MRVEVVIRLLMSRIVEWVFVLTEMVKVMSLGIVLEILALKVRLWSEVDSSASLYLTMKSLSLR